MTEERIGARAQLYSLLQQFTPEEILDVLRGMDGVKDKFVTDPIFLRAAKKVHGAREKEYGDKVENFQDIADFWTTFLRLKLRTGARVTRTDVALMQDLTKTARLMKMEDHEDSRDDKVGYVLCFDEILQWQKEQENARLHHSAQGGSGGSGDSEGSPVPDGSKR